MTTWWDDYNLPTIDSISGADLMPVYSQQNGAKRNVSAANVRTFMQENNAISGGILALSSVYEMFQTAATQSYSNTTQGVEFLLNTGLAGSRIIPTGAPSITLDPNTGGFIFNRDCQAVSIVGAFAHNTTGTINYSFELKVKIIGVNTYEAPLRVFAPSSPTSTTSGVCMSGILCNPTNPSNMIKKGEIIRFYGVRWSGSSPASFVASNQYFSVQTLDGV